MKLKTIMLLLLLFTSTAFASSISVDIGNTSTIDNEFSIPNKSANRINLPNDSLTSFRLTGYFDLKNDNQIYFLLAPLETKYSFVSDKSFEFDGELFNNNANTSVNYKFNSYRLGYLWKWKHNFFDYWLGVVGKIRDARIQVQQGNQRRAFNNIGFVPLASFGFEFRLFSNLSIFSHTDALGASQGSAYDSQIELKYSSNSFGASFGKRVLGGGADNDTVYNFAQFNTLYFRLSYYYD